VYKFTLIHVEESQFSLQMVVVVVVVLRILNMCSGFFCSVCGLISLGSWFF